MLFRSRQGLLAEKSNRTGGKISIGVIWDYLVSQELTYENNTNGVFTKMPTQKGADCGILLEEKTTATGIFYKLIKYPPKVQKMIVDSLIGPKTEENRETSSAKQ